jgi:hypothetical protein
MDNFHKNLKQKKAGSAIFTGKLEVQLQVEVV